MGINALLTMPSLRCAKRTQKGGGRRGNRRFPYTIGSPYFVKHWTF